MNNRNLFFISLFFKSLLMVFFLFLFLEKINAQHIPLKNASFEKWSSRITKIQIDNISETGYPLGWTERDIRYIYAKGPNYHGLKKPAFDGVYYVFLVTGTKHVESLVQDLEVPLQKDSLYTIYLPLAWIKDFKGTYKQPIQLRILGSKSPYKNSVGTIRSKELEILGETPVIDHTDWQVYAIEFRPTVDIHCIVLQSYNGPLSSSSGNLLIDSVSLFQGYNTIKNVKIENEELSNQIEKRFKGGTERFLSHFHAHLYYPKETRSNCGVGKTRMHFTLTETGKIKDIAFSNILDESSKQVLQSTFLKTEDQWLSGEEEKFTITFAFTKSDMLEIQGDLNIIDSHPHKCMRSEMLNKRLEIQMEAKAYYGANITLKKLLERFPDSKEYHQIKKVIDENLR